MSTPAMPRAGGVDGEALTPALRAEIEGLLAATRDGLSELSFAHLYLFREQRSYRFQRGELPCIAGVCAGGERYLMPLFDVAQVSADRLWARLKGYDCYYPIGQKRSAHFSRRYFVAEADAADSDYVYPVENFLDYGAPELDAKRKRLGELFERGRPVAVPYSRGAATGAHAILRAWTEAHPDRVAQADFAPCTEAIEQADALGLQGHVYYAEDVPVGFALGELVASDMYAFRFVKALPEVESAFEMMFHHMALSLGKRVRWFNFEQDFGLERLRRAKLAFDPSMLLQKFRVRMALRADWPEAGEASAPA